MQSSWDFKHIQVHTTVDSNNFFESITWTVQWVQQVWSFWHQFINDLSTLFQFIIDPDGYIIRKWQSEELNNGILSGKFTLPEFPKIGFWKVRVDAQGQINEKEFKVLDRCIIFYVGPGLWTTSFIYKYETYTTYHLYETTRYLITINKWRSWVQCVLPTIGPFFKFICYGLNCKCKEAENVPFFRLRNITCPSSTSTSGCRHSSWTRTSWSRPTCGPARTGKRSSKETSTSGKDTIRKIRKEFESD